MPRGAQPSTPGASRATGLISQIGIMGANGKHAQRRRRGRRKFWSGHQCPVLPRAPSAPGYQMSAPVQPAAPIGRCPPPWCASSHARPAGRPTVQARKGHRSGHRAEPVVRLNLGFAPPAVVTAEALRATGGRRVVWIETLNRPAISPRGTRRRSSLVSWNRCGSGLQGLGLTARLRRWGRGARTGPGPPPVLPSAAMPALGADPTGVTPGRDAEPDRCIEIFNVKISDDNSNISDFWRHR
jgi:hypothetical protein